MDLNKTILIGRLTKNAELKYTSSGTAVCNLSIATNSKSKINNEWQDEANFFEAVLWGKQAEKLNQYLLKGKTIAIEGKLKQKRWNKEGKNFSKILINIDTIQLLGNKNDTARFI